MPWKSSSASVSSSGTAGVSVSAAGSIIGSIGIPGSMPPPPKVPTISARNCPASGAAYMLMTPGSPTSSVQSW